VPQVNITQPANDTLFNQTDVVTITANITDSQGIGNVNATITFNGTTAFVNLTPAGGDLFQANFTNTTFVGDYNITILARDTNGNINNTEQSNFSVRDSQPPFVRDLTPVNGSVFSIGFTLEISANVTDNNSSVSNVSVNITLPDTSIVQINLTHQGTGDIFNTSFTVPNQNGTYTVLFIANDTNNNFNETEITIIVGSIELWYGEACIKYISCLVCEVDLYD